MKAQPIKVYRCLNCNKECNWSHAKTNKYCDTKCQLEFQYKTYIAEWQQRVRSGSKGQGEVSGHVRRYLFEKFESKCFGCGIDSWQDKPITLEIEHKDGNSLNQTEDNLILLCPNCHSQTPTYKSKNRGKGRHSRKQRYQEGKSY